MVEPLNRRSLANQIAERLGERILRSDLRPGDLLPPAGELAEDFGVSRPVVRESLKSLEGQGFIRLLKGKGAEICSVDGELLDRYFARAARFESRGIVELLEVRRSLEPAGAALAAERRTPDQLEALHSITAKMADTLDRPSRYAELDVAFHVAVGAATNNKMLTILLGAIRTGMKHSVLAGLRARGTGEQLVNVQRAHDLVFDAIERRDADGAAAAMRDHFDSAVEAIVRGSSDQPARS